MNRCDDLIKKTCNKQYLRYVHALRREVSISKWFPSKNKGKNATLRFNLSDVIKEQAVDVYIEIEAGFVQPGLALIDGLHTKIENGHILTNSTKAR